MNHYLIVGLGNYGQKYEKNLHNAGFLIIDGILQALQKTSNQIINEEKKFSGLTYHLRQNQDKFSLLKPHTFMNNSGKSVSEIKNFYKIGIENILVIHDELDFEYGKIKFKHAGGDAGHNGLKSITNLIGGGNYWRLRIGVGRPSKLNSPSPTSTEQSYPQNTHPNQSIADYVLSNFDNNQINNLYKIGLELGKNLSNIFDLKKHELIMNNIKQIFN